MKVSTCQQKEIVDQFMQHSKSNEMLRGLPNILNNYMAENENVLRLFWVTEFRISGKSESDPSYRGMNIALYGISSAGWFLAIAIFPASV
jgi:hypothetical protein